MFKIVIFIIANLMVVFLILGIGIAKLLKIKKEQDRINEATDDKLRDILHEYEEQRDHKKTSD